MVTTVQKQYSRKDVLEAVGISDPTLARYIAVLQNTIPEQFGHEPYSEVFTLRQIEALKKLHQLYNQKPRLKGKQIIRKLLEEGL